MQLSDWVWPRFLDPAKQRRKVLDKRDGLELARLVTAAARVWPGESVQKVKWFWRTAEEKRNEPRLGG